jgi:hypothetical protein
LRENEDVLARIARARVEDLLPFEALRIEGTAEQYAEIVAEALLMAATVQEAYDELRREDD